MEYLSNPMPELWGVNLSKFWIARKLNYDVKGCGYVVNREKISF